MNMNDAIEIRMTCKVNMKFNSYLNHDVDLHPLDQLLFKRTDKGWIGYKCSKDLALPKRIREFKDYEIEKFNNCKTFMYRDIMVTRRDGVTERVITDDLQLHNEVKKLPFMLSHILRRHAS